MVLGALVYRSLVWYRAVGYVCPKHVERTISFAIKNHLLHLVDLLFPRINDDARSVTSSLNARSRDINHNYFSTALVYGPRYLLTEFL